MSTGFSRPLTSAGRRLLAQRPDGPYQAAGAVYAALCIGSGLFRPKCEHILCARPVRRSATPANSRCRPQTAWLGRAVTATRTRAAPHRPPAAVTCCRKALCGTTAVGAPRFGCSSVLREHLRTIRSACLVNSSENTHNTAPSSCSRARVSRRLLCSPRDGLCSITFNIPTTSATRHQLDTRDSVHSRQEPQARVNQREPRECERWRPRHGGSRIGGAMVGAALR